MLKAIHAQEDLKSAREKATAVALKLREMMKLSQAAEKVETAIEETLSYMHFPREHRLKKRLMREPSAHQGSRLLSGW